MVGNLGCFILFCIFLYCILVVWAYSAGRGGNANLRETDIPDNNTYSRTWLAGLQVVFSWCSSCLSFSLAKSRCSLRGHYRWSHTIVIIKIMCFKILSIMIRISKSAGVFLAVVDINSYQKSYDWYFAGSHSYIWRCRKRRRSILKYVGSFGSAYPNQKFKIWLLKHIIEKKS